ncbi:Retrovirus-related Pol polyprotein from transposon 412 [Merluccius polli]|uniref:Gypsy retrotransposon integrase-like protein 1 n=1 Tax=Merluccius polli TaxID=89951 RepID=A0AA47M4E1_MERPO|nr:Retrovirus-related Pol polyprotein from transposon 412 [Merluccius polli]
MVIMVGSQRVDGASELFYAPVSVSGQSILKGMLDSGSMSCTLNEEAESKLKAAGILPCSQPVPGNVVLIGCGGLTTRPKCIYDLDVDVYGFKFIVPTFVVSGQKDELIIGSNVIRPIIQEMKSTERYWELISSSSSDPECEQFLQLLSCVSRWSGPELPSKIGTVRLRQAVTLLPQQEYVVWAKLPSSAPVSPGSTVIVEPTSAWSTPKNILVGRLVTPIPVTLRRNAKLADVSPCLAVEDLPITQGLCETQSDVSGSSTPPKSMPDPVQQLKDHGLADIDIDGCGVSAKWKKELAELLLTFQDVFSKDKLDCGEAKDFDLMKADGCTPSQKRVRSFLGMVLYYQHFIPGCSSIAKPLFALTAGQKRKGMEEGCVQDSFRLTCQPQSLEHTPCAPVGVSMSEDDVSFLLSSCDDWDSAPRQRAASMNDRMCSLIPPGQDLFSSLSLADLQNHQQQDSVISRVFCYVDRKRRPSRRERCNESQCTLRVLKQWEKLTVLHGVLYRVTRDPLTKHKRFQYILPESLKSQALSGVHDLAGHQGQPRSLSLAHQRFFWHDMEKDVRSHVRNCHRCVLSKTPEPAARAPLESIKTTAPLELVCIDFWSAEDSNNKSVDVLVITDHFTKLAHAFPCQDQTARKLAKKLWDNFFCVYGFPQRLHSDQGANFESELIAELLELAGVNKSRTSPYHPMGNGGTERFNRTLGNMLRSLPARSKQKWPQMIQTMTFVYNCTAHETTGFAPFYLMFGRVPRLPVDLLFKNVLRDETVCGPYLALSAIDFTGKIGPCDYNAYVKSLASDLHSAMLLAQRNSAIEQQHQSDQYNKKVKGLPLSIGDQVLVANKGGRGKRKLADKWEPVVHTVVASKPSLHIYKIRDRVGHERVVHRNLLLQVSFLPLDESLDTLGVGSVNDGCPMSNLPESEASANETDCGAVDPTMADSLSWVSGGNDDRTASWVKEQSPVRDEDAAGGRDLPTLISPALDGLAGAGTPLSSPSSEPHVSPAIDAQPQSSHTGDRHTSRFGRVIKPVLRFIESMAQLETVLGDRPVSTVIHV